VQLAVDKVLPRHATISNVGGKCLIKSKGRAANRTSVNGISIAVLLQRDDVCEEGIALAHSDRISFSQCFWVFVDPHQCSFEQLISGRIVSYAAAQLEQSQNRWRNSGLKFVQGMVSANVSGANEFSSQVLGRLSVDTAVLSRQVSPSQVDPMQLLKRGVCEFQDKDHGIADPRRQFENKAHSEGCLAPSENRRKINPELVATLKAAMGAALSAIEHVEGHLNTRRRATE